MGACGCIWAERRTKRESRAADWTGGRVVLWTVHCARKSDGLLGFEAAGYGGRSGGKGMAM
jgi:hypothetical protein